MSCGQPMPIEDGITRFLQICDGFYPRDAVQAPIEQQRQWYDAMCRHFDRPLPHGLTFLDGDIDGIPVRQYLPRTIGVATTLLYLHGGGFVVGSLESHHAICAEIADFCGASLVSVDYRLAPEYCWPAATDDGFAVLKNLLASGKSVVLIGDSAGGNLAAGLALRARNGSMRGIVGQALIYPALGGDLTTGSYLEMAEAPGLTTADVASYRAMLQAPIGDPIASPLLSFSLAGLPPAFISAAYFDPLRDDSRQYAIKLAEAGVNVSFREEPQMVHAWLRARHMSEAAGVGFQALCDAVRRFAYH